jgi:hypothetical protein
MAVTFPDHPNLYGRSMTFVRGGVTENGLFAKSSYAAGQVVLRLDWHSSRTSEILSWEEVERREDERVTAIVPGWYFHALSGHPFWFLNHSCDPNLAFRDWARAENSSAISLVSLRKIESEEEILMDYSTMTSRADGQDLRTPWTMKCLCKSDQCRQIITHFAALTHSAQLPMTLARDPVSGIVPAFIVNESPALLRELQLRAPDLYEAFRLVLKEQRELSRRLSLEHRH